MLTPNDGADAALRAQEESAGWARRVHATFERRGASVYSLGIVALAGVMGLLQFGSNALLSAIMLGVVGYEFQKRIDQGLPLMQIAALISVMQWLVGPALMYQTELWAGRLMMYVEAPTYFSYALPATSAFVFGLLAIGSSVKQRGIARHIRRQNFVAIGVALNLVALLARKVSFELIPDFALHLVSQAGYVGALYFLFSRSAYRWPLVAISLYPLFNTTAESAMFHDFLLWIALLFFYWYGMRKHSLLNKALLLTAAVFLVFTIQAVKQNYREKVWSGEPASLLTEAAAFWFDRELMTSEKVIAGQISRLNQGWIVSTVLRHVPEKVPFAEGETLKDAVIAALVPRFLMPGKVEAGGRVNFLRFTGLNVGVGTSMSISPLGEAYANFGRGGGIALMLVFGLATASFYALCLRRVVHHPEFLFWIPLIFYQALKAETEFATVLNQLTKGAVVAFGLHYFVVHMLAPFLRNDGSRRAMPRRYRPADLRPHARSRDPVVAAARPPKE